MTAAVSGVSEALAAAGRACGSCTLCCKVYNVVAFGKPAGTWCSHCEPTLGCAIHDSRPGECAAFDCLWKTMLALPVHWKPDQAKMVLTVHPHTNNIQVVVDPDLPAAWTRQPYHSQLRLLAKSNMANGHLVIVFVGELATLILPDQDVPLGALTLDQMVSVTLEAGASGSVYEVKVFNRRRTASGQTLELASSSRHPAMAAA
ncbi:hypothetical protein ACFQZO_35605 [Bradyrhizobium sp. GCM10027634]|uniref:hypothetical protein n=1 Tax=unclassified Bradyrhizobium TaxID=2631580 RepID=UPI00188A6EFB|nr:MULTISPECIES: hypothetical protein [unclassified Bradyrhizobium]MDN5006177.1 hypothetical protein [Bradyrhizobium sp. WYCCWR 12677]QOZ45091.1 hypothetical protein XH89_17605 [Bradyrhizobium sp. CCBAU 53340]